MKKIFLSYSAEASAAAKPIVEAFERQAMRVRKWVVGVLFVDLIDDIRNVLVLPRGAGKVTARCVGAYPEDGRVRDVLEVLDRMPTFRAQRTARTRTIFCHGFFSQPTIANSIWNMNFRGRVIRDSSNFFRRGGDGSYAEGVTRCIASRGLYEFPKRYPRTPAASEPRHQQRRAGDRDWLGGLDRAGSISGHPELAGIDFASGSFSLPPTCLTEHLWKNWNVAVLPSFIGGGGVGKSASVAENQLREQSQYLQNTLIDRSNAVMLHDSGASFSPPSDFGSELDGEDPDENGDAGWIGPSRTYSYGSPIIIPKVKGIKTKKKPLIADLSWTEDLPLHNFRSNLRQFLADLEANRGNKKISK